MTIQEAIRSGKKFKIKGTYTIYYYNSETDSICDDYHRLSIRPNGSELLSEEWEVFEDKIEISRKQLEDAWNKVLFSFSPLIKTAIIRTADSSHKLECLAKELGFKS